MEPQPNPSRHFVSECPLPNLGHTSYIVAPDALSVRQFKAAALALIADAGLAEMQVAANERLGRSNEAEFELFAYESLFDTVVVYANGPSQEEALASFSSKLNAWAASFGLLATAANDGKELASA